MGSRRTKKEITDLKQEMYGLLEELHPMTVRQVFYQMVTRGLIEKSEREYKNTIVRLLSDMRKSFELPFDWIADNTRWMRKPTTYHSLEHALRVTKEAYRRSFWDELPVYVEIWLEKEALAGVLYDVTWDWDVPLMVTRGYPSLSYLFEAAGTIQDTGKPTFIYYFGDHDPSGVDISRNVREGLQTYAPDVDITFERVAVTPQQITDLNLLTRPTKKTDSRSKNFKGESVEVDAIHPMQLKTLVRESVFRHLNPEGVARIERIEAEERETLNEVMEFLN